MKKITAFVFILLANIILLVHAVVPHHHHQEMVCLESNHCQSGHTHDDSADTHNHDQNNTAESCALKVVFALPSHFATAKNFAESCFVYHIDTDLFQALTDATHFCFNPPEISNEFFDFIPIFHSKSVNLNVSLRAPPIV
ncbi:MAG: hypothetical protein Q8T08_19450 [Ignavibacteria bacterium]|nr:hypothetical protein [Ignavibacteria bacterium]